MSIILVWRVVTSIGLFLFLSPGSLFAMNKMPLKLPKTRHGTDVRKLLFNRPLQIPFSVLRGRITLGMPEQFSGFPVEAGKRLYLIHRGRAIEIHDLNQLRDYVSLKTCEDALAFVRLKTSPRTFYALADPRHGRSRELEVILQQKVTRQLMFGDAEMAQWLRACSGDGYYGIVDTKHAQRLGVRSAQCRRSGLGYKIQRFVIIEENYETFQYKLVQVTEWVGKDGRYELKKQRQVDRGRNAGVRWIMPHFR